MTDFETMNDATVRVERIIWIPGAVSNFVVADDMKRFIEDFQDDERLQQEIYRSLPALREIPLDDEDWLIEEGFAHIDGFLVHAATPIMKKLDGHPTAMAYSWGYYRTKWFYVDKIENVAKIISDWAEKEREVVK